MSAVSIYDKAREEGDGASSISIARPARRSSSPPISLCCRAYPFNNTLLLLTAGIGEPYDPRTGKGVVGKNYC